MLKKLSLCGFLTLVMSLFLTVSASALTQLAAPSELTWGVERWDDSEPFEAPGMCSYKVNYPCQNEFEICLYSTDSSEPLSSYSIDYGSEDTLDYCSEPIFSEGFSFNSLDSAYDDPDFPSGTYYFTVQSLGDGERYRDSEIVTSPFWTYTAPEEKLPTPTNLWWDGMTMRWDGLEDTDFLYGYIVDHYWKNPETGTLETVGGSYGMSYPEDTLSDWTISEYGNGTYYFRVRATSMDMTEITGSYWSELSPPFNLGEIAGDVDSTLDDIYNTYEQWADGGTLTEGDAYYMKEQLWYDSCNIEDLAGAMAADPYNVSTNAYLEDLEALVGGPADVYVEPGVLEGMDSNISIVGANLNTYGLDTATLNIGHADPDTVIPEQYHNAIQFSMELDGVETNWTNHQLMVPVKITLPVPESINPNFLVLLHFHNDGTYEEIAMSHIFEERGMTFVSFIVTSFSDFAMVEQKVQLPPAQLEIQNIYSNSVNVLVSCSQDATVVAAVYDGDQLVDTCTKTVDADTSNVTLKNLSGLENGNTVRVFLLDEYGTPLCPCDTTVI